MENNTTKNKNTYILLITIFLLIVGGGLGLYHYFGLGGCRAVFLSVNVKEASTKELNFTTGCTTVVLNGKYSFEVNHKPFWGDPDQIESVNGLIMEGLVMPDSTKPFASREWYLHGTLDNPKQDIEVRGNLSHSFFYYLDYFWYIFWVIGIILIIVLYVRKKKQKQSIK